MTETLLSRRLTYNQGKTSHRFSARALAAKKSVERKIREKIYTFEEAPCFCGGPESDIVATVDGYGLWYPLALCRGCGLLRTTPRMTQESYVQFYDGEYRTLYGDHDVDPEALYRLRIDQGNDVYQYVRRHVPGRLTTVLDVGCNMGAMLVPFHREGSAAYGVDFNKEFLRLGRVRTGIDTLLEGDVGAFAALGKRADLMLCSHVVEHFLDLEHELLRLRRALTPTGVLYVEVPETRWWTENVCGGDLLGLLQNAHTWQFDLPALTYVMECCGFELVHAEPRIRAIFRVGTRFRDKRDVPPDHSRAVLEYLRKTERRFLPRWYAKRALSLIGIDGAIKKLLRR